MDLSPQDPRSYAQGQKQVMIELENIVRHDGQIRQMIKDQALALLKTMANQPETEFSDRWKASSQLARPVTMEAVRIYGRRSSSPSIVNINDDTVAKVNVRVADEVDFEANFMKNKLTDAEQSIQAGQKLLKSLPREAKDEMAKWDKIIALGEVAEREVTTVARLDLERIIENEAVMAEGLHAPGTNVVQQAAEQYLAESRDRIDGLKRDYQAITEKDPDRADTLARWAASEKRGTLNKGLSESIRQAAGNDYRKGVTTVTTLASITPSVNEWMARAAREYVGPEGHAPGEAPFTQAEIEVASQHALLDAGHDFIEEAVREGRETARREIQGERAGKLAEWAVTDEEARATILAGLRDEFKIDELSTNPRRDQDMGTWPGTKETMRHLAMRYVGPEGAEPGGQPFTIPEAEAAAGIVVSNNPELVEQAANEGRIEAMESRERDWEDALEYNSEHIEGLPEGWIKVNDYLYTGERGYTIMSLEEPTQYEYRASDGYSRWDGEEWSPAAKGEDPVQQIKDMLEQAEQGKVNALVQATHAPEASEPVQDMQARPQTAQDRPRNPRMEISR